MTHLKRKTLIMKLTNEFVISTQFSMGRRTFASAHPEPTTDDRARLLGYKDAADQAKKIELLRAEIRLDNYQAMVQMENHLRIIRLDRWSDEAYEHVKQLYDRATREMKEEPHVAFWGHYRTIRAVQKAINRHDHAIADFNTLH